MDAHELKNDGLEFNIKGKKYLIKRFAMGQLLSDIQKGIKEEYVDNYIKASKAFEDVKDRNEYLDRKEKTIPKGKELDDLFQEKLTTDNKMMFYLIHKALNTGQKITPEEASELTLGNADIMSQIVSYALCLDKISDTTSEAEKKTEIINPS